MRLRIHEADVPIHDTNHPDRHGVHVFTGAAHSPAAALRRPDRGRPRPRVQDAVLATPGARELWTSPSASGY
ncbi:hypothetical protein AB0N62_43000 [Streptomyces sp. NPDC093982]|uniref:hypothetical protein n=1 Tax=Streptomyces sp. NPDC093982 TaxID=3155077 RepID=UPI0034165F8D